MKTVIFDLDGTLVDSGEDIAASVNHVRKSLYGLPPLSAEEVASKLSRPDLNPARELYGVEEYGREARELFEEHYKTQCLQNARCYPGVKSLLERLRAADCDLFVATNAPTATSRRILQNNHVDRFFTDIIGADRVEKAKPDPQMLRLAAAKARYRTVWMVGDSPKDVMAARGAGAEPLFVRWGYGASLPEELSDTVSADTPERVWEILFAAD